MENEKGKIYESLQKIMQEMKALEKGKTNAQQGYKYRGIDDLYNSIQPLMAKHGVICLPRLVDIQPGAERTSKTGAIMSIVNITVEYCFAATDGSKVFVSVPGCGMDSGDKAIYKALSGAHKYALLQMFLVPTEDLVEPEQDSHEVVASPVTRAPRTDIPSLLSKIKACATVSDLQKAGSEISKLSISEDIKAALSKEYAIKMTELKKAQEVMPV